MKKTKDGYLVAEKEEELIEAVEHNTKKDAEVFKDLSAQDKIDKVVADSKNKKEYDKIAWLKSFLQEDRKKYESLGCGYHNGVYYFGTKLSKDDTPYTAVVTSDKKLYIKTRIINQIKAEFGLQYKEDFWDESLSAVMSKEAIDWWLFGDTAHLTLKSVYDQLIKDVFRPHIYFDDERKYYLLACYRIAGYFMSNWTARARLFIFADMGSAKSRLTQLLHNTGFNSIALGDWTLPYIKNIIESTRGETHIDDFETLGEEQKNATIRLVKVGYMRGFKAGKMSDGGKRKPEVNDLFNTTTLNNTEGLDFISVDRCLTLRIPKVSKKEYDKEPDYNSLIFKEMRDKLYVVGLKFADEVKATYDKVNSDKIKGRYFSVVKPELTIARLIGDDVFKALENFLAEELEQTSQVDYETDWEFLAYKEIYKLLSTLPTLPTLTTLSTLASTNYFRLLEDVVKPIGRQLYGDDFEKKKRSMTIKIGLSLKRNTIFKKREVKGVKQYTVKKDAFISFLEAKGFLKQIKEITEIEISEVGTVDSVDRVVVKPCDMTLWLGNNYGSDGCPESDFVKKFGQEALEKLKNDGVVFEKPQGFLRLME